MNDFEELDYQLYKFYLNVNEAIACTDDVDAIKRLMKVASITAEAYEGLHELIEDK